MINQDNEIWHGSDEGGRGVYSHLPLNLTSSPILLLLKNPLSVFCESSEMSIALLKLPPTELIEVDKMGLLYFVGWLELARY